MGVLDDDDAAGSHEAQHRIENLIGPAERYDILEHLPNVQTPLLVTIGGEEGIYPDKADRFAFGGLAEKVATLASDLPSVTFELIPGADHAYTNRTDQLWSTVERWLTHE